MAPLLAALLWAAPAAPDGLAPGQVVERVVSRADPGQAYALYLPSRYHGARRWPTLYLLDARGRALTPLARFKEAAERHGLVLASSYNSASDGPVQVTVDALRAMWTDTQARLSLDEKRTYLAGFSGTARTSCSLAAAAPGRVAGVVLAGAGFPSDQPPRRGLPYVVFGIVGDRDFNYDEMRELDETLGKLGAIHRVEVFAGGHEWPPPSQAGVAVRWLEVQAMREGRVPVDADLVQELWASDLERARRAESAGDALEAHRLYAALAAELDGLRDVSEAAARAAALAASPGYARALRGEQDRRQREARFLEQARQTLAAADPAEVSSLPRTLGALQVRELKDRARDTSDPDAAAAAERRLNTLLAQTGFYLPRRYRESGEHARAAFFLALAAEIEPEEAGRWVALAAARARAGQRDAALTALETAAARGWSDAGKLEDEEAFQELRRQPRFERLLRAMRAAAPPPTVDSR